MVKCLPIGLLENWRPKDSAIWLLFLVTGFLLAACDSGGSQSAALTPTTTAPPTTSTPPAGSVTISGTITFDLAPLNPATNGLDYNNITQVPARGVTVQAVDGGGTVIDSDITSSTGAYSVTVQGNSNIRIQALAQLVQSTGGARNIRVLDNTSGNALYTLAGGLVNSGTANSIRNLNAPSGWNGTSYAGTRAAAPFAILDSIYAAVEAIVAADNTAAFPNLEILWSINNKPANGNISDGDIGTSSFVTLNNVPTILILGSANNDTDEYDRHVVVHEFGHYFENQLARSDSTGGAHNEGDFLDPTVAFSEGWGNAFSAIVLGDTVYRDSGGPSQASGFRFDVEDNNTLNSGWFSEFSVQSIIYDIFDSADDGADVISAGFGPIYAALTNSDFTDSPEFTTIFSFLQSLRNNSSISDADISALSSAQLITGTGAAGAGETNDGGVASSLPLYKTLSIGGAPVTICSVDDKGVFNKLGNTAFLRLSVATTSNYTLTMTQSSGLTGRDPDFRVTRRGQLIANADGTASGIEQTVTLLPAGEYAIRAFDFLNSTTANSGDSCFDFTAN